MSHDAFAAAAADFIKLLAKDRPEHALAAARLLESLAGVIRSSLATSEPAATSVQAVAPPTMTAPARITPEPASRACVAPPVASAIVTPPQGPKSLPITTAYVPLKIGDTALQVAVAGTTAEIGQARLAAQAPAPVETPPASRYDDLELIETRCQIKAESCLVHIARRAASDTPEEEEQVAKVRVLLQRAKALPDCFLWVFFPERPQPNDATLNRIAANYANLAKAARIAAKSEELGQRALRLAALELLAEAQSALRVSLRDSWLYNADHDQNCVFTYLNHSTKSEGYFIEHYMRLDDPADPEAHDALTTALTELEQLFEEQSAHEKGVRKLLSKLKHHARMVQNNPDEPRHDDWQKIEQALGGLLEAHVNAADPRLSETLDPIRTVVPEDLALPVTQRVLSLADGRSTSAPMPREYSADVLRVRGALRGSAVVLVGGERRPDAEARIRDAFELREVVWVSLSEHASSSPAQAPIHRADVKLVFVLVKLAGHQHVEDVSRYARDARKPVVRVPAGYNPEQLAAQALAQAIQQLEDDAA
ncbi:MAG: hypothetical protein WC718_15045 [Phycisphaerales bacterium]|jgi:hypothetical protein